MNKNKEGALEANFNSNKPIYLYHGSLTPNIDLLEPRKRYAPRGLNVPERVYASDLPAFAVAHACTWDSDEGFDLFVEQSKVIFKVPAQFKDRLAKSIYLYKVNAAEFQFTPEEVSGHTYHSQKAVKPIEVQSFSDVQKGIEFFGGEVVFIVND